MQDARLGHDDEFPCRIFRSELQQRGRAADVVGHEQHRPTAFGMGQHLGFGMELLELQNLIDRKFLVYAAGAVPHDHVLPSGEAFDVVAQIAVRSENDLLVPRETFDHLHGIARRAADIGQRLDAHRRIDVGNDRMTGIVFQETPEILRRAGVGERTAGFGFGQEHFLVRRKDLGRLGHEVYAGEENDPGVRLGGPLRERQTVAGEIGDLLDLRERIVMRENHGVLLLLERGDLFGQRGGGFVMIDSHFYFSVLINELKRFKNKNNRR